MPGISLPASGTRAAEELPDWPESIAGGKLLKFLGKFLSRLRDERPHGNQELFLDDVFVAQLLAFFNPSLRSLRTLEDFSQTRQAQRHLSVLKLAKSTLSDFHKVVDPALLEPVMKVEVVTPEDYMGDIIGDLNRRRGIILSMEDTSSGKVVTAEVPLAEMFGYSTDVRSASQGRATFTMEFNKYAEVPGHIADAIISRGK